MAASVFDKKLPLRFKGELIHINKKTIVQSRLNETTMKLSYIDTVTSLLTMGMWL